MMPFCDHNVEQNRNWKAKTEKKRGLKQHLFKCYESYSLCGFAYSVNWPPEAQQIINYEFTSQACFATPASICLFLRIKECRPD